MKKLEDFKLEQFQQMLDHYPINGFNAFTPLIHAESKWVFTTAYAILKNREDAEDVRNDSLVKWIQTLHQTQDYGKLTRPFLHTIIKNRCFDLFKKQKKVVDVKDVLEKEDGHNEEYALYGEIPDDKLKRIYDGVKKLCERCHSMLLLELETKLTQAQILQQLKIPHTPASISGLFRNCKNKLRKIISN
ncbi:MAG: hypothetical protein RIS64_3941 [Bacteroidota bacterium]